MEPPGLLITDEQDQTESSHGQITSTNDNDENSRASSSDDGEECVFDVAILGGGVVGCAVLRQLTLTGRYHKVILLEKEPHLLEWASGSNSGIVCTGVDAPMGSLERALIRDSISQIRPFLRQMNVPHDTCGSLVCAWGWEDHHHHENETEDNTRSNRLDAVLKESHDAGDTHARLLNADTLRQLEPNLRNDQRKGAVHIPGEIVVDPWLYSIALAVHARENGATIRTNFDVNASATVWDGQCWTIRSKDSSSVIQARAVVNATGLWSDQVQRDALQTKPSWTAKPRRGQYRIYRARNDTQLRHPIQPVPTPRTKGVFVFGTLYHQIVVGPTALDQDSKTDRTIDKNVATALDAQASRIVPHLQPKTDCVGEYVGIRPGTNHRDYQFHVNMEQKWIAATGIRSTGLTASLGIGRHVGHLLQACLPISPISSTATARLRTTTTTTTTPLPPVDDLIRDFGKRGDGTVEIHGHIYKVTHPITRLGWQQRLEEMC